MSDVLKAWVAAVLIMLGVTVGAIPLFCHDWFPKEMALGWAVSIVSGAAGTWMHRRAMSGSSTHFFAWGVLGSVLRLILTVVIILGFCFWGAGHLPAFAVTVVAGYLSFTAAEVGLLYRHATAGAARDE